MFYTIIPTTPIIFAVQPDAQELTKPELGALLKKLQHHFLLPVVLVSWDANGVFTQYGSRISEDLVTDEDLVWREFELPADPEIPF